MPMPIRMGVAIAHLPAADVDPADIRFWPRTQRIGVALTLVCCAFVIAYLPRGLARVSGWSAGRPR